MSFRILDHTADAGIELQATSLHKLFGDAAQGLFSVMVAPNGIEPVDAYGITAEAVDRERLLVEFLTELLGLQDAHGFLLADADVKIKEPERPGIPWRVSATVRGEPLDPDRHIRRTEVKAVTYHRLRIEQTAEGWRGTIYLDL